MLLFFVRFFSTADDQDRLRFLCFDLLSVHGQSITWKSLPQRLGKLRTEVLAPLNRDSSRMELMPFSLELEHMERSYGIPKVLDEIIPRLAHPCQGLVFMPSKIPYMCGECDRLYVVK
jgi:mRNA-capping enzyme